MLVLVLNTNKDVAGVPIVELSVVLVRLTLGINKPLFAFATSNMADTSGVAPVVFTPTFCADKCCVNAKKIKKKK
jgi:hypothetical protein